MAKLFVTLVVLSSCEKLNAPTLESNTTGTHCFVNNCPNGAYCYCDGDSAAAFFRDMNVVSLGFQCSVNCPGASHCYCTADSAAASTIQIMEPTPEPAVVSVVATGTHCFVNNCPFGAYCYCDGDSAAAFFRDMNVVSLGFQCSVNCPGASHCYCTADSAAASTVQIMEPMPEPTDVGVVGSGTHCFVNNCPYGAYCYCDGDSAAAFFRDMNVVSLGFQCSVNCPGASHCYCTADSAAASTVQIMEPMPEPTDVSVVATGTHCFVNNCPYGAYCYCDGDSAAAFFRDMNVVSLGFQCSVNCPGASHCYCTAGSAAAFV